MGLISELLGRASGDSPAPSRTLGEVEGAIVRLRAEREQARQALASARNDRERLLLVDGSEKKIEAADRAADAARLALERVEKLEPLLLAELEELRTAAKRERWRTFRKRYDEAARELARMLREALDKRAELMALHDETRRAGFEHEIASAFAPPPIYFTPEGAAHFEAAIERAHEMVRQPPAAASLPPDEAARRVRAFVETQSSNGIPKPRAPAPPATKPPPPKAARPAPPPRAARPAPPPPREIQADADGKVRIRVLRTGLEFEGKRPRAGDVLTVPLETAQAWLRAAAVDLAESGEGAA